MEVSMKHLRNPRSQSPLKKKCSRGGPLLLLHMRCHLPKEHHIFPLLRARVDQAPLLDKVSPQPYIQTTSDQGLWTIPQEDPAHPTIVPNPLTLNHCDNGTSLISRLRIPQKKTPHFSDSRHPGATSAATSGTSSRIASSLTNDARGLGSASSHSATRTSNSSARLEQRGGGGRPPRGDCGTRSQKTTCPLPNYGISWWRMPLMLTPTMTGKGVSMPITHHLLKGPPTQKTPSSSTPAPPRRVKPPHTWTTSSCKPSTFSPPPTLVLPTTRLQKGKRTSTTPC